MTTESKTQVRIVRCQRLVVLGIIAQKAGDSDEEARYLALYEREFAKLPHVHQLIPVHEHEVAQPVQRLFARFGVLGMRERADAEAWADEFDGVKP